MSNIFKLHSSSVSQAPDVKEAGSSLSTTDHFSASSLRDKIRLWAAIAGFSSAIFISGTALFLYYQEQQNPLILPDLTLPKSLQVKPVRSSALLLEDEGSTVPFIKVEEMEEKNTEEANEVSLEEISYPL